ncbi:MAG: hypothetical protein U9Q15_01890 [Patescibacteria group bacterium]|nr:hypothetical protein [Patescibacteria group bacterium]
MLEDELDDISYAQNLYEKIGRKMYGNSFNNNHVSRVSRSSIQAYFNTVYTKENILVCDDDFHVLQE